MYQDEQPKGLYLLFFTILWERFGYYLMQALLILYMTKQLGFTLLNSFVLFGTFTALLNMTPILGGILADRFLGYQRAASIGIVLMILGYVLIGLPEIQLFYFALSLLCVGSGLFRPSITCMVGNLYEFTDTRRDGGFTLFYMGINLGALFPPIMATTLVLGVGWYFGFFTSAVGLCIGVMNFFRGKEILNCVGKTPEHSPLQKGGAKYFSSSLLFYIALVLTIFVLRFVMMSLDLTTIVVALITLFAFAAITYTLFKLERVDRDRLLVVFILSVLSIAFWFLYSQMFTSVMIFGQINMERTLFGLKVTPLVIQIFDPLYIVVFAPLLSHLWVLTDKNKRRLSLTTKFFAGMLLSALGYVILSWCTLGADLNGIISVLWIGIGLFVITMGELFLGPIGLSMITRFAGENLRGMMIGFWYLIQAAGILIGTKFSSVLEVVEDATPLVSLQHYQNVFMTLGFIGLAFTLVGIFISPMLNRLCHE
ncbi:MAG: oligopeptide:H+ symporter [Simkaniaceae bacterium]|nr:oligopeptide:H+ symporter [Simkaniaceae bacterium]